MKRKSIGNAWIQLYVLDSKIYENVLPQHNLHISVWKFDVGPWSCNFSWPFLSICLLGFCIVKSSIAILVSSNVVSYWQRTPLTTWILLQSLLHIEKKKKTFSIKIYTFQLSIYKIFWKNKYLDWALRTYWTKELCSFLYWTFF